ncbi:MAG TPA: O-antigen polysaccharide polymerase Wzy [Mycobacteriales bacterium]|nr:O-antigen polysaccharide polymerase Wzy [Mycobacteriales bacterium]HVW81494.1 O-antigen polysaccharide polymerase Wzy [Mycobacteriales bacterium]
MLLRFRGTNLLAVIAAYFYLVAFGPVINLLIGQTAYFGTRLDEVAAASVGFTVALGGLLAADLLLPQRYNFDVSRLRQDISSRSYRRLVTGYYLAAAYMLVTLVIAGPVLVGGTKTDKVHALHGHYIVLLVEAALLLMHFVVWAGRRERRAYTFNAIVYLLYCVLSDERDFIFVAAAIVIHRALLSGRVITYRGAAFGVGAVVLAGGLVSLRSGSPFDLTAILNQGSLLFVDTFVRSLVPTSIGYAHGHTYVTTLHNILPFHVLNNSTPSPTQWLVNMYAPGSSSGYGFSLSAEAYMNFGTVGIAFVFMLVGLAQRSAVNSMDRSLAHIYRSMVVLFGLMYSIRGDSSQLLKTVFYAAVIYCVLVMPVRGREVATRSEALRTPVLNAARSPGRLAN